MATWWFVLRGLHSKQAPPQKIQRGKRGQKANLLRDICARVGQTPIYSGGSHTDYKDSPVIKGGMNLSQIKGVDGPWHTSPLKTLKLTFCEVGLGKIVLPSWS